MSREPGVRPSTGGGGGGSVTPPTYRALTSADSPFTPTGGTSYVLNCDPDAGDILINAAASPVAGDRILVVNSVGPDKVTLIPSGIAVDVLPEQTNEVYYNGSAYMTILDRGYLNGTGADESTLTRDGFGNLSIKSGLTYPVGDGSALTGISGGGGGAMASLTDVDVTGAVTGSMLVYDASNVSANLLTGGTPSASSTYSGYPASNAFDGDDATLWNSDDGLPLSTLSYDAGSPITANRIRLKQASPSYGATAWKLQSSTDGSTYTDVKAWAGAAGSGYGPGDTTVDDFPVTTARYWRFTPTASIGGYQELETFHLFFVDSGWGFTAKPGQLILHADRHTSSIQPGGTTAPIVFNREVVAPVAGTYDVATGLWTSDFIGTIDVEGGILDYSLTTGWLGLRVKKNAGFAGGGSMEECSAGKVAVLGNIANIVKQGIPVIVGTTIGLTAMVQASGDLPVVEADDTNWPSYLKIFRRSVG